MIIRLIIRGGIIERGEKDLDYKTAYLCSKKTRKLVYLNNL